MRPYPDEVLRAIQSGVIAHFAPELDSNYGKAQFAFSMLLFNIATRDYDTAVPDLLEANSTLRGLLAEARSALDAIGSPPAQDGIATIDALPAPAPSLKLTDLRAENDALRAAVASLSPLIEPAADEPPLAPLRELRANLYAWLAADAKKRSFPILSA